MMGRNAANAGEMVTLSAVEVYFYITGDTQAPALAAARDSGNDTPTNTQPGHLR